MGKTAFLFAGQGAQYTGMGKDLCECSKAAAKVFEAADKVRENTSEQCFTAPVEELSQTINTQPCVYCVDLAAARALEEAGVHADAVAGFSLGVDFCRSFFGGRWFFFCLPQSKGNGLCSTEKSSRNGSSIEA